MNPPLELTDQGFIAQRSEASTSIHGNLFMDLPEHLDQAAGP